jgi:hypothetical protein
MYLEQDVIRREKLERLGKTRQWTISRLRKPLRNGTYQSDAYRSCARKAGYLA